MKSILMICYILMCFNLFAQSDIVVIPNNSTGNWCSYETLPFQYRMVYQGVNNALSKKNFQPLSQLMLSEYLQKEGYCKNGLNSVASLLCQKSGAIQYITMLPEIRNYGSVKQVSLSLKVYDKNHRLLSAAEKASNKMPTDKYDQLAAMAFDRCYEMVKEHLVTSNGIYVKQVELDKPTKNEETIVSNKNTYNTNTYEGALRFILPIAKEKKQNAIAVVIGNRLYENQDIPTAEYATNDALLAKEYLTKSLGFLQDNVIFLQDASLASISLILGNQANNEGMLYNRLKNTEDAEVYFYFSGHGISDPNSKEAFLVTSDTNPAMISLTAYPMSVLYENLSKLPYKNLTVVIESCFSGATANGSLVKNASPIFINPTTKLLNDEKVVLLTASASDEIASWYPEKQHSLFTYFLYEGLSGKANKDKNKKGISLQEVENYTHALVSGKASTLYNRRQSPGFNGLSEILLIEF